MWIIKDNKIQDNSVRSCNNREAIGASQKNPGFSRGNLLHFLRDINNNYEIPTKIIPRHCLLAFDNRIR
jgi:hypothetical protein